METLANLGHGIALALSLHNIAYCFFGVLIGTIVGILPGIGALATISLLLPITFYMDPGSALIMLAGVYYGAEYGGSTSSILLNLPGGPANAVTCLDGYPMARKGRAGVALFSATIASFVGGSLGIIAMIVLSPAIVSLAVAFGSEDYFAVMLLGLVAASTITRGNPLKGLGMVCLGVLFGTVGIDVNSGVSRFDLGFLQLAEGISIVAIGMGFFGVSEIIASVMDMRAQAPVQKVSLASLRPNRDEVLRSISPVLRGSGLGGLFGALPGTGPTIASFLSYALEKRVARDPGRFGKGAIEGVTAPEAANNAAVQTAFIPTLTLGIPGSATMAIMMGALMIHGIEPGPGLMRDHPDVFWGLVGSFWIGNILLLILNIPMIGLWVRLLQIPYRILYPCILCLVCIGVYSINNSIFDIGVVLIAGILGYILRVFDFEPAPLIIGFILGPMMEENLRRAMVLSRGDPLIFLQSPISATVLAVTLGLLIWALLSWIRTRRTIATTTLEAVTEGAHDGGH
jgi:TctA family transporter